jgi:hypothetical protein
MPPVLFDYLTHMDRETARAALAAVAWPTVADYDAAERESSSEE